MDKIKVCNVADIVEDGTKSLRIVLEQGKNFPAFAVKKDGQIFVYINECPHLGVELNWQEDQFLDSDNALIQCSTHGALFLIESGECVSGPCQGEHLIPVPTLVENGAVYADMTQISAQ